MTRAAWRTKITPEACCSSSSLSYLMMPLSLS
jgi:hypothetical protein